MYQVGCHVYCNCLGIVSGYVCTDWGPVYTTVEKSTGHEKKGVSQLWLVENAILDRWVLH